LRALFRDTALDGDFGAVRIAMLVIGLLVIGGLRVTHLAFVGTDPILLRWCAGSRPSRRRSSSGCAT
jgi:hypothetical protein